MSEDDSRERLERFGGIVARIRQINRKYAEPRIHMSRNVKIALLFLRLYLIFLVLVLAYKFITTLRP